MQKLLVFLLVLLGVWYVRRLLRKPDEPQEMKKASGTQAESVRECCQCGLLVPQSEGVEADGAFFCCAEHARQGQRKS